MKIFEKNYDWESLYDLGEDVTDAIDERFNPKIKDLPERDGPGTFTGEMKVTIEYIPEKE